MSFGLSQEPLCVERRRAAGARGGDCLAVDMVLDVAGGEDARTLRLRRLAPGDQVAVLVVVERVHEELGRRVVADRNEQAVGGVVARLDRSRGGAGGRRSAPPLPSTSSTT